MQQQAKAQHSNAAAGQLTLTSAYDKMLPMTREATVAASAPHIALPPQNGPSAGGGREGAGQGRS